MFVKSHHVHIPHFSLSLSHTGATGSVVSSSSLTVGGIGSVVAALLASLSLSTHGMLGARTLACMGGHVMMGMLLWRRALQVSVCVCVHHFACVSVKSVCVF